MTNDHIEQLPAAHREKARSALSAVFGQTRLALAAVKGGATSASTFRVIAGAKSYLLRIEGEPSPLRNPYQYVSMRIAAEAGIAPPIRYLDEASRVAVIDFIDHKPLHSFPGGPEALAKALGLLLARVQSTPAFPSFVNYPEIVTRLFNHVRRTGLIADHLLEPHVVRLEELHRAYDADLANLVSSHNDFIPSNVLFDGERLWLIDWESAYRNDPLVDVAIVLDSVVRSPQLEPVLLAAWLGRHPDENLRMRLKLVRALTRLYYAGVALSASAAASFVVGDDNVFAPTVAEFEQKVRSGQLKPGSPETKHVMGKMFLASFLTDVDTPGFGAAV